jgi:hypothetical protein
MSTYAEMKARELAHAQFERGGCMGGQTAFVLGGIMPHDEKCQALAARIAEAIDQAMAAAAEREIDAKFVRLHGSRGHSPDWLAREIEHLGPAPSETSTTCKLCDWAFCRHPCDGCPDPAAFRACRSRETPPEEKE